MVRRGYRGVMVYALNRPEGDCFAPAAEIDRVYADTLRRVARIGVEVLAVRIAHGVDGMWVERNVTVELDERPEQVLGGGGQ